MGKKMKFPFLSKTSSQKWRPWPSCHSKTLSFRADYIDNNNIFKIINSAYNLECDSSSSMFSGQVASCEPSGSDCVENVVRGLRSQRLIFKPEETGSFCETVSRETYNKLEIRDDDFEEDSRKDGEKLPFKESVAMVMDSTDPILDFKRSMVEMVEAHDGFKDDWKFLEDLLIWYLRINGKSTHGYIVGAFVDLLVGLSIDAAATTTATATAATAVTSSSSSDDEHCLLSSTTNRSLTSHLSFTSSVATCSSSTGPYFSMQEKSHQDEIEKSSLLDHASTSSSSHVS